MRYAAFAALLVFAPALALPFSDYPGCLTLAKNDPAQALQAAKDWGDDGGLAAVHCAAMALVGLKRFSEAAGKLEWLAGAPGLGDFRRRAALYDQAGNAWVQAGDLSRAEQNFSRALEQTPQDADMFADRAIVRAQRKNWAGAEADLTAALGIDANRADLLVLRASARQALGHMKEAAIDVMKALEIYPDYPPALVERGRMLIVAGDEKAARRDLQKAAKAHGKVAEDAKRLLHSLGPEKKK